MQRRNSTNQYEYFSLGVSGIFSDYCITFRIQNFQNYTPVSHFSLSDIALNTWTFGFSDFTSRGGGDDGGGRHGGPLWDRP
jgi:hypothetical protein